MLKILGVDVVKNGCGQSYDGTLNLTVSEEWTNEINWYFACWCRFITKADKKFIGWALSKMVVASLVMGLWNWLYLKTEQKK